MRHVCPCWILCWKSIGLEKQFLKFFFLIFSEQGERSRGLPKIRILVLFVKTIPEFCVRKIFIRNVGTGGILCWLDD